MMLLRKMILHSRVRSGLAVAAFALFASAPASLAQQPPLPYASQLDPQMSAVLQLLQDAEGTPVYQLAPADARQQFAAEDAAKAVARATGIQLAAQPVASILDTTIPGPDNTQLPIRIYTPTGSGPFPVVLYFHGGGFVIATNDTYDASPRAIANLAGAIVISVEYRKAPEHPFPAALQDALATYYWTIQNAASVKGIPTKVAVMGESAGGNLAAELALLSKQLNIQQPVRQVLVYPVVDSSLTAPSELQYANAVPLSAAALKYFFGYYVPSNIDPTNPLISPLQANLTGIAPATIISAQIDPLMSQGQLYATKLKASGVAVDYQLYLGVTHEFFGMGAVVDKAKQAEQQAASDLRSSF